MGSSMKGESSLGDAKLRLEGFDGDGVEVWQVRVRVEVAGRVCALLDGQDVGQQQVWDLQPGDSRLLDVVFQRGEEDRQHLVDEAPVRDRVV